MGWVWSLFATVKIDVSEKLHNYYQVARRAKSDNDSETAAKYYSMILTEDPTSWEASFYSVYFRSKITALQQEKSALGFFKVKEKKAIQEQIDKLASDDLEKAKASREAAILPIQAQVDAATTRIAEIDEELTKER